MAKVRFVTTVHDESAAFGTAADEWQEFHEVPSMRFLGWPQSLLKSTHPADDGLADDGL